MCEPFDVTNIVGGLIIHSTIYTLESISLWDLPAHLLNFTRAVFLTEYAEILGKNNFVVFTY